MNYGQLLGIAAGCLIAAGLILLLIVVYLRDRQERIKPRTQPETRDRSTSVLASSAEDVGRLMDQLNELASRIDRRIESRLEELRRLLAEADKRIAEARLGRERERTTSEGPQPAEPTGAQEAPASEASGQLPERTASEAVSLQREKILSLKTQGLSAIEIARRMGMDVGEVELVLNLYLSSRH